VGSAGDQPRGYWEVVAVNAPQLLVLHAGFASADGIPNADLPFGTMRVGIEAVGEGRTRMPIECIFPSAEAVVQVLAMGTEEGMSQAVSARCDCGRSRDRQTLIVTEFVAVDGVAQRRHIDVADGANLIFEQASTMDAPRVRSLPRWSGTARACWRATSGTLRPRSKNVTRRST
jgi:uncharacterized protein YndB with AHSA1/START domain